MLSSINGIFEGFDDQSAFINVQGLGFSVYVAQETIRRLPPVGSFVHLETIFLLRQEQPCLFGFITKEEKAFFEVLITIQGVGPKVGLALLGGFTPKDLLWVLEGQDEKALVRIEGVGPKLARRLITEAKDKVKKLSSIVMMAQMSGASPGTSPSETPGNTAISPTKPLSSVTPSGNTPINTSVDVIPTNHNQVARDVVMALEGLGFDRHEAAPVVQKILDDAASPRSQGSAGLPPITEQHLIKLALQRLAKHTPL